jgi:hypothetical protein
LDSVVPPVVELEDVAEVDRASELVDIPVETERNLKVGEAA